MRLSRCWFLLLVLCTFSLTAWMQDGERASSFGWSLTEGRTFATRLASHSPSAEDGVKVETRLVLSDVLVLDRKGQAVSGLVREDFKVFENGREQKILAVTPATEAMFGRAIVLIIDYSESVLPYVDASLEAAKTLVDNLAPTDTMAIVTDDVELLADFTSDKTALKTKLDELGDRVRSGATGKSRQYCALMATLKELLNDTKFRPVIILQSDGDQYMNLKDVGIKRDRVPYSFRDVLAAAERVGATIYTILPGPVYEDLSRKEQRELARAELSVYNLHRVAKGGIYVPPKKIKGDYLQLWSSMRRRDQEAISKVAIRSGGLVESLGTPGSAEDVYSRILNSLGSRYVIGYYPEDQTFEGSRRTVTVKLPGHAEYNVYGRKSYRAW